MAALDTVGDIVDHFGEKEITPIGGDGMPIITEPVMMADIRRLSRTDFAKKYTVIEMRKFAKSIDVNVKGLREKAMVEKLYQAVFDEKNLPEKGI